MSRPSTSRLVGTGHRALFDAELIARANAVPNNDIWFPTHDELRAAHVVTALR